MEPSTDSHRRFSLHRTREAATRRRTLRFLASLLVVFPFALAPRSGAASEEKKKPDPRAALRAQEPCKILVVGFHGALETPRNRSSGIVKLRDTLNTPEYPGVCYRNFVPYSWPRARHWVLQNFPRHRGRFTPEELAQGPKVLILGHSMGSMSTLILARLLGRRGIPVELTVQLASFGLADVTVPANVKTAANFYDRGAFAFLTKKHVKAKNPNQTNFLGNVPLPGYGHTSITRAPQVSSLVISTVRALLAANPSAAPVPASPSPD